MRRFEVEYRCKVTVIDKNISQNCRNSTVQYRTAGVVRASTRETNLYSIGMGNVMTTGIWGQEL